LDLQPEDRLLEIGCGHGVAVSLVCETLEGGSITAIDRSPTMIETARRRNAEHVAAGRAFFHTVSLYEADFDDVPPFHTLFAIHVGVFLRADPTRDLEAIERSLADDGRLHLIYRWIRVRPGRPRTRCQRCSSAAASGSGTS